MNPQVNVALQVLPTSESKHPYAIVDRAIELIRESGVRYKVCPFETVMEGDYDIIMDLVKKIQMECLAYGAEKILSYLKIEVDRDQAVTIEHKMKKYQ